MTINVRARNALVWFLHKVPGSMARYLRSSPALSRILGPALNRLLPRELTPVKVRSGAAQGLAIVIEPRNEKFYWAGTHEQEVQDACREILREGGVFWDVGAHCGFFACLGARLVGPNGSVRAFEPAHENRSRLETAIELNGFNNIQVSAAAIGETNGEVNLHRGPESTMWTLIGTQQGSLSRVPLITLDAVWREGARPPDLVKIDVESAELQVLKGAESLRSERPPLFLVEFHSENLLSGARKALTDYDFTRIAPSQWLLQPS